MGMKLNLGCGHDKRDGWHNVDFVAASEPDEIVDLEQLPWPWPDNAADEVLLRHVLEHLGRDTPTYLGIIKELYRVLKAGGTATIVVPHPRHDHYLNDPTHVRPITVDGLDMFNQQRNREWIEKGSANTPLGIYTGVDFEIAKFDVLPDEPWRSRLQKGEIKPQDLQQAMRLYNNVIMETTIVLRARK
jgi:SAM-dependent methyltransferase